MKPEEGIRFLRQFQELLAEGGFTATYKFALLQALADLSVEEPNSPDGSLRLRVEQLAEKFIEYYWNQVAPFDKGLIRQNAGRQAKVIRLVQEYRQDVGPRLVDLRSSAPEWKELQNQVANVIIDMPLWKLQKIGNETNEFLYRHSDYQDRTILLLPGVSDVFRAFHPLLTNMIRGGWIAQIYRIKENQDLLGQGAELEKFLFGTDRKVLKHYRELLREHQSGECFYCGTKMPRAGDLDHFIPWSRYPVDLGHNFVFACSTCNNAKRDHLAAPIHIERWRVQNLDQGDRLSMRFSEAGLLHDLERSKFIACWAYQQGQASKTRWWVKKEEFEDSDYRWKEALGTPC